MNYKTMLIISLIPFLAGMKCTSTTQGNDDVDPDIICGVWQNKKEGVAFFSKGKFSWGENPYSISSVIIDLKSEERPGPYIVITQIFVFIVQEKESHGKQVVLTGYFTTNPNERREIIVTVIDENTITIKLDADWDWIWDIFPENPDNYHYRVPIDAPYDPRHPFEYLN
jgi:hypothetical protein